jgi:hypothetical protein
VNKRTIEIDTEIRLLKDEFNITNEQLYKKTYTTDSCGDLFTPSHRAGEIKPGMAKEVIKILIKQRELARKIILLYQEKDDLVEKYVEDI